MRPTTRCMLIVPVVLAFCAVLRGGQDEHPPQAGVPEKLSPLDGQLLNDLDSQLLDGLERDRAKIGKPARPRGPQQPPLDQSGEGEDVGTPTNPLGQIGRQMRVVEKRISSRDISPATQQLQQQIVDELSRLIEEAKKQEAESAGQTAAGSQASKTASGQVQQEKTPTAESSDESPRGDESAEQLRNFQKALDATWGNLPAKVREQLQNASVEQFLPKYEKLIEDFYKRLAEDSGSEP